MRARLNWRYLSVQAAIIGVGLFVMAHLAVNIDKSAPVLAWAEMPRWVSSRPPARGDWVQFSTDFAGRDYAKMVVGVTGDRITRRGRDVYVNNVLVGRAKTHARTGRALDAIAPQVIGEGLYYVWAPSVNSHDSRYAEIGLIPTTRINARLRVLARYADIRMPQTGSAR